MRICGQGIHFSVGYAGIITPPYQKLYKIDSFLEYTKIYSRTYIKGFWKKMQEIAFGIKDMASKWRMLYTPIQKEKYW